MSQSAETALKRVDAGSGYPVLLVHGSASDYRTWEHQIETFAACFYVVTYSRRYHWPNESISHNAEYSMTEQVNDLLKVIRSFETGSVHLVGHSYGAYLSLMAAVSEPSLVNKLVLAEPPVIPLFTSFPPRPQEILALLVTRPRTALPIIRFALTGLAPATSAARKDDMDAAMTYFGKAVLGTAAFDALSQTRLEQVRANLSKSELLSDTFMAPLNERDVAAIEARTLLVTGEKSPAFLHRLIDRLEELLPNADRVDIPKASHIMHEDNPDAYNRAVLSFLRQ